MLYRIFTLLILLLAAPAWGANWYVRPSSGEYGDEDGTSYAAAFDGFSDINWAGMSSGDTLYVCGTHRGMLSVQASGITVNLACPDDPARIYGSVQYTTGWSGPDGNGEYTIAHTPEHGSPFIGPVVMDGVFLAAGTAGSLTTGQWGWAENVLYLKDDPTGKTVEAASRWYCISMPNSDLTNLTVTGGGVGQLYYSHSSGIGVFYDLWGPRSYGDLVVDGVYIYGMRYQGIHAYATANWDNVTVQNCVILAMGGEGVYLKDVAETVTVTGNTIGSADNNYFGWGGEGGESANRGDGIDIGTTPATITNNTIVNIDGACISYQGVNATISGNTCTNAPCTTYGTQPASGRYNFYLAPDVNYTTGDGIVLKNNQTLSASKVGTGIYLTRNVAHTAPPLKIYNNVFYINSDSTDYSAVYENYWGTGINIYNNTFDGAGYGLHISGNIDENPTQNVKNNVFKNDYPVRIVEASLTNLAVANNLFQTRSASPPANPYHVAGSDYANITSLEAGFAGITNSVTGDPLLIAPSSGNFGIAGNSPAKDAGAVLYTYAAHPGDFLGAKVYGAAPDIGAIEYKDHTFGGWFFEMFIPTIFNLCASTNANCYTQP